MYTKILLKTSAGAKVGFFQIPQFNQGNPPLIRWGERLFTRNRQDPNLYFEIPCFAIPETQRPMQEE